MVFPRSLLIAASTLFLAFPTEAVPGSPELQSILKNTHKSPAYSYPTDFTRGILPIPVHSHNDYWRDVPFYTALSHGCISVEADVWLYNGTLFVGHDQSSLTDERTFESLYVNPILEVVERQNPESKFLTEETKNGVFDASTGQTLYLFVDSKTSGPETFEAVIAALEPLREKGYLTTLKGNETLIEGPVTVIGTGNTPYDMVGPVADREYFYDGPLATLDEGGITALISPIASTSFTSAIGELSMKDADSVLSNKQLSTLRSQISVAKEKGILARYWGAPAYPIRARNLLWATLLSEGVGLLNADDLAAAAEYF
ncbi:hypothetical protein BJX61DRAFT_294016 [Aspergillus egyptiacus]|nr:hypothetical protein BJX61DRAFT_294016 [Aspergillus egyptiacus]